MNADVINLIDTDDFFPGRIQDRPAYPANPLPAMRERVWTALSGYPDGGHKESFSLFICVHLAFIHVYPCKIDLLLCTLVSKLKEYKRLAKISIIKQNDAIRLCN